ncbi:hypothetical protein PISMIDRAFT_681715 [Pisolithus microcarpus 441]|uniref:Uncharacterized protein n=1 Tax=Pisolithus microcarpus 441 TaxID=765257 RepID=A0A0C9Y8Z5_9AGAM|nr:hypothetical protein PISMIDRAFT_681715 [Pisolithus microcarpus 441]
MATQLRDGVLMEYRWKVEQTGAYEHVRHILGPPFSVSTPQMPHSASVSRGS